MSDILDNGSTLDAEQRERITNKLGLLTRTVLVLFTLDPSLVLRRQRPLLRLLVTLIAGDHTIAAISEAIISLRAMDMRGFPVAPLHDPWAPIASADVCRRELRQLREDHQRHFQDAREDALIDRALHLLGHVGATP